MARMFALFWNTLKWFSQNQVICSCNWRGEYSARRMWRDAASRARRVSSCWYACWAARFSSSFFRASAARRCCSRSNISVVKGCRLSVRASICACAAAGSRVGPGASCSSSKAGKSRPADGARADADAPQVSRLTL
jgi:hypothetical protein